MSGRSRSEPSPNTDRKRGVVIGQRGSERRHTGSGADEIEPLQPGNGVSAHLLAKRRESSTRVTGCR